MNNLIRKINIIKNSSEEIKGKIKIVADHLVLKKKKLQKRQVL